MKKFAFFLPQFHEIPENNKWWGKGFTEWTNVKAARPLFRKHKLKHPFEGNYYNLLSKETVEWQTRLMDKYRIDGLIYYHYYFNGKKLLEKPAENLLTWHDVDQKFFFCWANHPWIRSWEGKKTVLMPMNYGNEQDWENHFQYLLPFFKDDRYEKKDNMPLFMLFKPNYPEKYKMMEYFNSRCIHEGFNGLCVIESNTAYNKTEQLQLLCKESRYVFQREPDVEINSYGRINSSFIKRVIRKSHRILFTKGIPVFDGNKLMQQLIKSFCNDDPRFISGLWFEWDNTYRHRKRGYIITPYKKELFMKYMDLNMNKDYIFLNAWNEWCEGMTLEPTEENRYKYLEWIKEWSEKNDQKRN